MPAKYKVGLYIAAWAAALWLTNPDCRLAALAWMFPLGLAAFVRREWANAGGWGVFFACVLVYIVHAYFYFRATTRRNVWILFSGLALLLICNVQGCRAMIDTH